MHPFIVFSHETMPKQQATEVTSYPLSNAFARKVIYLNLYGKIKIYVYKRTMRDFMRQGAGTLSNNTLKM